MNKGFILYPPQYDFWGRKKLLRSEPGKYRTAGEIFPHEIDIVKENILHKLFKLKPRPILIKVIEARGYVCQYVKISRLW